MLPAFQLTEINETTSTPPHLLPQKGNKNGTTKDQCFALTLVGASTHTYLLSCNGHLISGTQNLKGSTPKIAYHTYLRQDNSSVTKVLNFAQCSL